MYTCILVFKNFPGVTPSDPSRVDEEGQGEGESHLCKEGKGSFISVGGMGGRLWQTAVAGCSHVPLRLDLC